MLVISSCLTSSLFSLSAESPPSSASFTPPHRVPDPDPDTEQHPPDDHHRDVHRPGAQRRAQAERRAGKRDRGAAPGQAAKGSGEERGDDSCDVERGGEELQELVVVLLRLVMVFFCCLAFGKIGGERETKEAWVREKGRRKRKSKLGFASL